MLLNPLHLSVAKLFESRLFRIPDYQRAYSWQKKQRSDLFGDIDEAYRSGREHFMATVVALARETRSIAADEFRAVELVDGQQRITTIVILLKAIEKVLEDTGNQSRSKRDLGDLLVKGDDHSLVLLQTNHDSSNVFTTYLRKGKLDEDAIATASDQNLIDAARECEAYVATWAASGKLIELLATVKNRLSMIYHELADEATVYRVFEVLNSRGLDVRWIDKTKSQMMSSIFEFVEQGARADGLDEMREIWKDVYRKLGMKLALGNEALRFAGTFSLPDRPNRVLGEEEASIALLQRAGREISTIVGAAEWLRKVVRLVHELNSDVRRAAVTKIAQARFLAIAIMLREFEPDVKEKLLGEWEKVTFRIFGLGGADTRMKVGEYVRLSHDVLAKELAPDEIIDRTKALGASYDVKKFFDDESYWDHCYEGWTEELRYLLFRYDEHLAEKAGEKINTLQWNKIWTTDPSKSIEHIVPQSQEPAFKHHLGNLTMLPPGINSSLQADPPEDKADAYLECGIRGTMLVGRAIREGDGWSEADVKKRAANIEDFVRSEWTS